MARVNSGDQSDLNMHSSVKFFHCYTDTNKEKFQFIRIR